MAGILLYLAFFSIGMGCTPWTLNAEIYPLHLRGIGLCLSTTANWVSNFIVSELFLTLTSSDIGQVLTFVAIALFAVGTWIFVYYLIPETKGKDIEEIVLMLCPHLRKEDPEDSPLLEARESEPKGL